MKFIDEASVSVQSGNGGPGCVSFRREKFIPRGGPDGGDGGKGGDVIFTACAGRRTLYPFRFKRLLQAENGQPGQGVGKTGRKGRELLVELPPGTLVIDAESGDLIKDLALAGDRFIVARGGRGGKGNAHFKTSTHRTPRFAQPGEPGQTLAIRLELKLLADVGIVGLPNAGKSTLIAAISAARPKIADYPFTTLVPSLGVVQTVAEPFVVADIPGLIEGAHQGAGLGIRFLRHVERTRLLVHLIDAAAIDSDAPLKPLEIINNELHRHSTTLAEKRQIVVLNKMDLTGAGERAELFRQALGGSEVFAISAATGQGTKALVAHLLTLLDRIDAEQIDAERALFDRSDPCRSDPDRSEDDRTEHDRSDEPSDDRTSC